MRDPGTLPIARVRALSADADRPGWVAGNIPLRAEDALPWIGLARDRARFEIEIPPLTIEAL